MARKDSNSCFYKSQLLVSQCVPYEMFLPYKRYLVYLSLSIRSPSLFVRTTACPLSNGANHARCWGFGWGRYDGWRTHCCDRGRGRQIKQSSKQTLLKIIQKFMLCVRQRLQFENSQNDKKSFQSDDSMMSQSSDLSAWHWL